MSCSSGKPMGSSNNNCSERMSPKEGFTRRNWPAANFFHNLPHPHMLPVNHFFSSFFGGLSGSIFLLFSEPSRAREEGNDSCQGEDVWVWKQLSVTFFLALLRSSFLSFGGARAKKEKAKVDRLGSSRLFFEAVLTSFARAYRKDIDGGEDVVIGIHLFLAHPPFINNYFWRWMSVLMKKMTIKMKVNSLSTN